MLSGPFFMCPCLRERHCLPLFFFFFSNPPPHRLSPTMVLFVFSGFPLNFFQTSGCLIRWGYTLSVFPHPKECFSPSCPLSPCCKLSSPFVHPPPPFWTPQLGLPHPFFCALNQIQLSVGKVLPPLFCFRQLPLPQGFVFFLCPVCFSSVPQRGALASKRGSTRFLRSLPPSFWEDFLPPQPFPPPPSGSPVC